MEPRENDQLSPQLRNVLILRTAGYTHTAIGEVLGISRPTVHTYIKRINKLFLKGITADDGRQETGFRIAYVLGLIDAGCTVPDVQRHLLELESRVRRAQIGTPRVRQADFSCNTRHQLASNDVENG